MPPEAHDLKRFENAHTAMFDRALAEIRSGDKRSHWMWFVFPQVEGLGSTATALRYAIRDWGEAVAFLEHPVLGANYRAAVGAVAQKIVDEGMSVVHLFPYPDDLKLVSSLTLFTAVARSLPMVGYANERWLVRAEAVLNLARAEGYERCAVTERFLARERSDGRTSGSSNTS